MIRISTVRVIDEDGEQLGIMPTPQALSMAQERGYDLVEVAPMASPPVVRFLDFGQYKYELAKREKEAKRRQRAVTYKEIRLRPKIGVGDFETKVHRAVEFLEDGDRIKVTVQFRGRELTHPEIGRALLERFVEAVKLHGVVERAPQFEGRLMHTTIASVHKPKVHEAAVKVPARTDGEAAETAEATPTGEGAAAEMAEKPKPSATTEKPKPSATTATTEMAEKPKPSAKPKASATKQSKASEPVVEPAAAGE